MGQLWHACQRKERFSSYQAAYRKEATARRRGETCLTTYWCKFCHGFHVGHVMSSESKRKQERIHVRIRR